MELSEDEDADFKQVTEAVMRESIINLARIKETFSQAMNSGGDSAGIDSVPALIRGIKAGLLMLEQDPRDGRRGTRRRTVRPLALWPAAAPQRLTQKETDRLADAIVSIEYYMETVRAGRREPWYMLDNAEACLSVLQETAARLKVEAEDDGPPTQIIRQPEFAEDASPVADGPATDPMNSTDVMPMPVVAADAEHLDPELLELFIEEAKEEVASIKRSLPAWAEAPDDMEALITVRAVFPYVERQRTDGGCRTDW